jgi:hypothetical protein
MGIRPKILKLFEGTGHPIRVIEEVHSGKGHSDPISKFFLKSPFSVEVLDKKTRSLLANFRNPMDLGAQNLNSLEVVSHRLVTLASDHTSVKPVTAKIKVGGVVYAGVPLEVVGMNFSHSSSARGVRAVVAVLPNGKKVPLGLWVGNVFHSNTELKRVLQKSR